MTRRARRWAWLIATLFACALAACGGDGPGSPPIVTPEFGDPCVNQACSDRGRCVVEGEAPRCLCEPGYGGPSCAGCENGFHLDALGRCAPDRSCAEQSGNPCGAHGACDDESGVIECKCDLGYEGPRCSLCQSGWDRNQFGECLQVVLGGGGDPGDVEPGNAGASGHGGTGPGAAVDGGGPAQPGTCAPSICNGRGTCDDSGGEVVCACHAGYDGETCGECAAAHHRDPTQQCVPDVSCEPSSCSGHGNCDDDRGVPECSCNAGYAGDACEACAPGFHAAIGGGCELDSTCLSTTCDGHGTCSVAGGVAGCACNPGYSGTHCTSCATGYHRGPGDACVIDEVCTSSACGPHGDCSLEDGEIQCACDAGYVGDACDTCGPGFHLDGSECLLDQQCQPTSCPLHSVCDDDGGSVTCACDPGYTGTLCNACAPGYYRFYAEGTCVVYDCHANPIDVPGSQTFEAISGFPSATDTCVSSVDVSSFELVLTSIDGDGSVWACGPSAFYELGTHNVLLEAGVLGPAALRFAGPIAQLSFDYGAQTALALEIAADGVPQRTLNTPRWSSGSVSLTFAAPISYVELRSLGAYTNQIALDNITFTPPVCE